MRLFLAAVAFSLTLPFPGVSGESADTQDPAAPVTVYTQFEADYSDASITEMKSELKSIMAPMGVSFEWRSVKESGGHESVVELVVISFKGRCELDGTPLLGREKGSALGWTHMSDGQMLPFSDIECDRIRALVRPLVVVRDQGERDALFGRAMARVLAHEMYHMFTKTAHHGHDGIAKAVYSGPELVARKFHFDSRETKLIRSVQSRTLIRTAEPVTAGGGGGE
jgi:hypothetical protein